MQGTNSWKDAGNGQKGLIMMFLDPEEVFSPFPTGLFMKIRLLISGRLLKLSILKNINNWLYKQQEKVLYC
jgi:hypothetical protein